MQDHIAAVDTFETGNYLALGVLVGLRRDGFVSAPHALLIVLAVKSSIQLSLVADEEASEPTAEARSRRPTPKITAPTQVVPKHWQRLEMNGKIFYVVPADEIPGRPHVKEVDGNLRR